MNLDEGLAPSLPAQACPQNRVTAESTLPPLLHPVSRYIFTQAEDDLPDVHLRLRGIQTVEEHALLQRRGHVRLLDAVGASRVIGALWKQVRFLWIVLTPDTPLPHNGNLIAEVAWGGPSPISPMQLSRARGVGLNADVGLTQDAAIDYS